MGPSPLPRVIFLDACVLYPAPIRDLFMGLALKDLVRLRWSERVHEEWIQNVISKRPDLSVERLKQVPHQMALALESQEPLVKDYEHLIPYITLPDEDDRHVVAAAVFGRAEAIVTFNRRDFPPDVLEAWDLVVYSPDDYLVDLTDMLIREKGIPGELLEVLRTQRSRLKNPPLDANGLLTSLERAGLKQFVQAIRQFHSMI